jgi:hypothetical protein
MFPCSYSGTFTALLAWTFLEVPLDLAAAPHLNSVAAVLAVLKPQFAQLCAGSAAPGEVWFPLGEYMQSALKTDFLIESV